jgi:pimeloyl-ACP methyl ester carboxylesterase
VITDAGTHPAVAHLVYVAAFPLDAGENVHDVATTEPEHGSPDHGELGAAMTLHDDGTITLDRVLAPSALYGDCSAADVARALDLLRPQHAVTFLGEPRAVGWRERPTTYVVCGADRGVPPSLQRRLAERIPGAAMVELDGASHSPFLSRPGELVELLAGLA